MLRVRFKCCHALSHYEVETPGGTVSKDRRGRSIKPNWPERCPVCHEEFVFELKGKEMLSDPWFSEGVNQVEEAVIRARWKDD